MLFLIEIWDRVIKILREFQGLKGLICEFGLLKGKRWNIGDIFSVGKSVMEIFEF